MGIFMKWLVAWLSACVAHPPFDGRVRKAADGSLEAYLVPPFVSNHAATIEQLDDGLALAWFSGVKEEANDCSIVFARLPANASQWTNATLVSRREGYSNQNPVLLFADKVLHLYHSQAPALSGEDDSTIFQLHSPDRGHSWSKPVELFTRHGAFPRNRIIPSREHGFIFPIYNASSAGGQKNYAIMETSDAALSNWTRHQVQQSGDLVQPSVVRLRPPNDGTLRAFFRDRRAQSIYTATSTDEACSFSTPVKTPLPNNNAGIEANVLSSGAVVLVFNDYAGKGPRTPLTIALSEDNGVSWPHKRDLQVHDDDNSASSVSARRRRRRRSGGKVEFSYPTVLQTSNGDIHVAYTYDRATIKYKVVTESWIKAGNP